MKAFFILGVSLVLFSCNQVTAQAKFYITAPKSVPVNQNFQLNVVVENGNPSNLRTPSAPDFQIVGGPNQSTSMQWVNGNVTQSITFSYILKPKKEGTFKIGKAGITISGVNMESNELNIDITKAAQQAQRQSNPYDPFNDPFFGQQQQQPEESAEDLAKQLKDDVFIKLYVSKSSVYTGEMLTATYKLYFKPGVGVNITSMDKVPASEGFWSQEVELDAKRRPTTETVNGKQYNAVELMKYNLYPQRGGTLKISPAEVGVMTQVQGRARSVFDAFFNGGGARQVPLKLKTETGNVNVLPVPEKGKPADFTGAVGKFNFETSISSHSGKTDDPITYTIKISGTGNLKLIEAPAFKLPPAFEVYDPKMKENITNGAAGLSGSKQYDYLIIPRQPGEYKIDKREFSYFDPSAGKYFTITSPEYALKITGDPSKNPNTNAVAGVSKQDISLTGQDIRYIKTNTPQFDKANSFFGSTGYFAMYFSPALLFIGLVVFKRRNESLAADVVGTKRRRAIKLAKKRLSIADKYLKASDKKPFYDEVSRAMWGYLGDKLSIDMAELSKDNVEEKLVNKSVKIETISSLKNLINTCEIALYAPIGENGEMKKNYETALNLIADLEDEIK